MKTRELIITPFLSGRGGTETVLKTILNNSSQRHAHLLVLGGTKDKVWLYSVLADKVMIGPHGKIKQFLMLGKLLRTNQYDHVICMSTTIIMAVSVIRTLLGNHFSIISWIHFSLNQEKTVKVSRLKLADKHLAISLGIRQQLIDLGISEKIIKLVRNPIKWKSRTINKSMTKCIQLAFIGRITLDGQKNLKELFLALKGIHDYQVELHIYGVGEILKCQEFIRRISIHQKIIWHGWVKDPWTEVKELDAVILTSKYEGLPMVLLEAISYGIPVISADCPTGPRDIINKDNGLLYNPGNISELKQSILSMKTRSFSPRVIKGSIRQYYLPLFLKNFWNAIDQ